jgi:hypothetical protein
MVMHQPICSATESHLKDQDSLKEFDLSAKKEAETLLTYWDIERAKSFVKFVLSPRFKLEKEETIQFWENVLAYLSAEERSTK